MSYGNSTIEEIKSRCDIVDVIGRVVPLKRAGSNYKGLCPFHGEKTPSFVVSQQKQIFTCFGCGASGDVIEFVKRYENLDFGEAVEKLAKEYNVEIKNNFGNSVSAAQKEKLYELNRDAAKFFYKGFREPGNKGLEYMKKRGMNDETLKRFGIGYADETWDSLDKHMEGLGYDEETMVRLGLLSKKEDHSYDKFRNRVIFPIINAAGKVIGFGGRAIGDDMPKYLNSSESEIYLKKNNLFGLNLSKNEISRENRAILVEGYMDVMALYQGGIRNVCASCGTALTENQAKLLKRYTSNVVLCYDADSAGRNAALRGLEVLQKEGIKVKVMHVTDGKDPDEFIKAHGKDAFLKLVDRALPLTDYKLASLRKTFNTMTTDGMVDYVKAAVKVLRDLSPVEADAYISKLSKTTGISVNAIRMEYENAHSAKPAVQIRPLREEKRTDETTQTDKLLLKLALRNAAFVPRIDELEDPLSGTAAKEIFKAMKAAYVEDEDLDASMLYDGLDFETGEVLKDIADNVQISVDEELVFKDCADKLRLDRLRLREAELMQALSMAADEDEETSINIQTQLMEVQREIQKAGGSR